MKNCDYEITYYQDGIPKKIRVPALEVDEDLTAEELELDLKQQIKDVFKSAMTDENHILHKTVNDLTKAGVIFQPTGIIKLPAVLSNTPSGLEIETAKTEYDGNVKLADLKSHLDTATHPYSGLMRDLLNDEDLSQPTIHFIAEKYNPSGDPDDDTDSAFGVYIRGDKGIDTIKVYTGSNDSNLDVLNADHEIAKVLAHEMVHHKTSRKLEEWFNKDRKDFRDTFNPLVNAVTDILLKTLPKTDGHVKDIIQLIHKTDGIENKVKELFAYALTDRAFAAKLNYTTYDNSKKSILSRLFDFMKDFLGIKVRNGSVLQEVLTQYNNLHYSSSAQIEKTPEVDTEQTEEPDGNPEFARIIDPFIYQQVAELPAYDADQTATNNGKIWRNFFDSTQNEYSRYSINYGEAVSTLGPTETLAGNDASLFRLKQNDIIRYNMMKKEGDTWVKDLSRTGYSPIIYSYFNKDAGQTMFVVATQQGPRHVAKDNILGYRKFYGNIRESARKIPAKDFKAIIDAKVEIRKYFNSGRLNASLFNKLELYKNQHKLTIFKAKDDSAFFLDKQEAQLYFRDLGPNDLVQVRKYNDNPKAKKEFNYYTVLRVLGNAVEVVDKNNQPRIVEKRMINGALLLKENHGDIDVTYKEQFGDLRNNELMTYFDKLKKEANLNFTNQLKLKELFKANQPIPKDLEYLLFENKQELFDENGDFVNTKTFTSLKDFYEMEFFTGDETVDYKFKKIGNLERGSIVLLASDIEGIPYRASIVLDFDEVTGRPVIGNRITSTKPKTVKLKNGKFSTFIPQAFYKVEQANIEDIIGVGSNLIDNPDLNIYADKDVMRKIEASRSDFTKSQEYKTFNSVEEAQGFINAKKLTNYDIAKQYVHESGKISFTPDIRERVDSERYVLKHNKTNQLRSAYTPYRFVSGEAISRNKTEDLWNAIAVGDTVKKRYTTAEGNRYIEGVIVKKTPGSIVAERSWIDRESQEIKRINFTYYVGKDALRGNGLKDITNIGFSFKGRTDVDELTKRLNKTAITAQKPTATVNADAPFSKDFESNDKRDYRKSAKTSKQLLGALTNNLEQLYGIKSNLMDSEEIANMFDINPNATLLYSQQRAFVMDGEIYINTDKASLAEPIHEMGHILMQGLKVTNNSLYQAIISKFAAHPQFDNIAKFYPELDQDRKTEEVFVTTLGEMFNGRVANSLTKKWESDNRSFLSRVFGSIKNFLADLFGINNKKFLDVAPYELMNMSFDEIHSSFGNSILNGDFTPITQLLDIQSKYVDDGTFLMNADGDISTIYSELTALDVDPTEASNIWLKTKTPGFMDWAGGNIALDSQGEPQLFVAKDEPNTYGIASKVADPTKLVFLKGTLREVSDGVYKVLAPSQAKSIYSIGFTERTKDDRPALIRFAEMQGIKMEGFDSDLKRELPKLQEKYPDLVFEVKEGFGTHFISYYTAPSEDVQKLKLLLMRNNKITEQC